jgi:hypothetical protein
MLAIVQAMRGRHAPTTAAALASEFNVSERTIYAIGPPFISAWRRTISSRRC